MIQIDPEEDILKVLDIDWNQVKHIEHLRFRLECFEGYIDADSNEHIYPLLILDHMDEQDLLPKLETEIWNLLKEIRELCDKHECSYWRIINIP